MASIKPHSSILEHAGIHLAEEMGEFSEAILKFRNTHTDADFSNVILEGSDLFSCFMGVFNSIDVDYEKELVTLFSNGCHICKKTPCVCNYKHALSFAS